MTKPKATLLFTCICGRPLKPGERPALFSRPRCPDCGSRTWTVEFRAFWSRLFRRRKPQAPRYTPEHPGPRYLGIDYGFEDRATATFLAETDGKTYVTQALGLKRRKNRWRFDQL